MAARMVCGVVILIMVFAGGCSWEREVSSKLVVDMPKDCNCGEKGKVEIKAEVLTTRDFISVNKFITEKLGAKSPQSTVLLDEKKHDEFMRFAARKMKKSKYEAPTLVVCNNERASIENMVKQKFIINYKMDPNGVLMPEEKEYTYGSKLEIKPSISKTNIMLAIKFSRSGVATVNKSRAAGKKTEIPNMTTTDVSTIVTVPVNSWALMPIAGTMNEGIYLLVRNEIKS
jgi:hypothetical protein